MVEFKLETPADGGARERLLHASFGQGRFRKTAEKLRRGFLPAEGLAFSTLDEAGQLIGTLRFWRTTGRLNGCSRRYGRVLRFYRDRLIRWFFEGERRRGA